MSYTEQKLVDIADAIRDREGSSSLIPASTFPARIRNIPSGGVGPDEYYYYCHVGQVLISADRLQYLQEAWDSRHQITVDASGNVTGVTGTPNDIVIPEEALTIPDAAYVTSPFYPHRASAKSLTLPNDLTSIGNNAFYDCYGFTGSLIIPNSVTSIGQQAFQDCGGFTGSLTLSNSLTSIGDYAFHSCSGFTGSLTIPNSVTSIGDSAFYDCYGFTGSLTLSNSLTSIGDYAFHGCYDFTSVVFEGQAPTLRGRAFGGCEGILEYDFTNCYSVPILEDIDVFDYMDENCIMKVPAALEAAWKAATNWATYADKIVGV